MHFLMFPVSEHGLLFRLDNILLDSSSPTLAWTRHGFYSRSCWFLLEQVLKLPLRTQSSVQGRTVYTLAPCHLCLVTKQLLWLGKSVFYFLSSFPPGPIRHNEMNRKKERHFSMTQLSTKSPPVSFNGAR